MAILASSFKSKCKLESENVALRHQVVVLRRQVRGRVRLMNFDRLLLVQPYRWFPSILKVSAIVQPEAVICWHRSGFRSYWRWKSRARGGRPVIEADLRALIRQMSIDDPLWGAPRIHGELLKLGCEIVQSTVATYVVKRWGRPLRAGALSCKIIAPDIGASDLFVVPTISFSLLYALVIIRLDRRALVWINVKQNPTAKWIAREITEAFP